MKTLTVNSNDVQVKTNRTFGRNFKAYSVLISGHKLIGSDTNELSEAFRIKVICQQEINNGQSIRVMSDNECIVMPKFK